VYTKTKVARPLGSVSEIRFGTHSQILPEGTTAYLQARHFSPIGEMTGSPGSFADGAVNLNVHQLKDGEVLMAGKGAKNFAWTYRKSIGPAVASTLFYVITVDQRLIYPEYLAALINLPTNQAYFQKLSSSSSVASLRKKELAEFEIPIPTMQEQQAIAKLAELHKKELMIAEELIQLKKDMYLGTITKLLN
jgi:restriction endonuclease S subunit